MRTLLNLTDLLDKEKETYCLYNGLDIHSQWKMGLGPGSASYQIVLSGCGFPHQNGKTDDPK